MRIDRLMPSPWSGVAFGLALFVFAFGSAGAGHGSYLPFALFAAPLSLIPVVGLFAAPVWWGAIGWLLKEGRRPIVVGMLGIHALTVAGVLSFGTLMEPGAEQWRYFRETHRAMPVWLWTGIALYVVGLVAAWSAAWKTPVPNALPPTSSVRTDGTGTCDECRHTFAYTLIHNGFNDSAFAYCDCCGMTALFDGWSPHVPAGVDVGLHGPIDRSVEALVEPCGCGGRFRGASAPRCSHCHATLSAERASEYIERNAAGTASGWRWQRRWNGLYAIVVDNRVVQDPWRRSGSA